MALADHVPARDQVPFESVLTAQSAGYLASNVLPGRAGEAVRFVLMASDQPVGAARVLSTMLVERLLDTLSLLAVLALLLPFLNDLPEWMTSSVKVLAAAATLATILIVVLSFFKERVLACAHAILRHIRFLDKPGYLLWHRAPDRRLHGPARPARPGADRALVRRVGRGRSSRCGVSGRPSPQKCR